jgi:hypothetical protein
MLSTLRAPSRDTVLDLFAIVLSLGLPSLVAGTALFPPDNIEELPRSYIAALSAGSLIVEVMWFLACMILSYRIGRGSLSYATYVLAAICIVDCAIFAWYGGRDFIDHLRALLGPRFADPRVHL